MGVKNRRFFASQKSRNTCTARVWSPKSGGFWAPFWNFAKQNFEDGNLVVTGKLQVVMRRAMCPETCTSKADFTRKILGAPPARKRDWHPLSEQLRHGAAKSGKFLRSRNFPFFFFFFLWIQILASSNRSVPKSLRTASVASRPTFWINSESIRWLRASS